MRAFVVYNYLTENCMINSREGEGDYRCNKMYLQAKINVSLFILIHFVCFIGPFYVPADLQLLDCTFSTVSTC